MRRPALGQPVPGRRLAACAVLLPLALVVGSTGARLHADVPTKVLEDFQVRDESGFPAEWEAQRSKARARESYRVESEGDETFLSAKQADQRVFKRMAWDPKAYPVITWKWRLRKPPPDAAERVATVYVTLDTDLLFIPVFTKYTWSLTATEGTTTHGGMFSGSEIVVQSGGAPIGEWVEERVNAYEDFKRLHDHEPAPEAWGISLLAAPGVEIDFGPLRARAE